MTLQSYVKLDWGRELDPLRATVFNQEAQIYDLVSPRLAKLRASA